VLTSPKTLPLLAADCMTSVLCAACCRSCCVADPVGRHKPGAATGIVQYMPDNHRPCKPCGVVWRCVLLFTDDMVVVVDDDIPEGTPPSMVCHITRATADKSCKPGELKSRTGLPGKPCLIQQSSFMQRFIIRSVAGQRMLGSACRTVHADSACVTSIQLVILVLTGCVLTPSTHPRGSQAPKPCSEEELHLHCFTWPACCAVPV